ncbi:MAG: ABC-ATPase domain-containing protein [Bacteroidales bacterium]
MKTAQELSHILNRIDKKGYKAYKDIEGVYHFEKEGYKLIIDHVQGDPFATPSNLRVIIPQTLSKFPKETYSNKSREVGTRDFITRLFAKAIKTHTKGNRGSGKSGTIDIDKPGQEILERTSAFINKENIEVRFNVGLPALGRKIAGEEAKDIFFREIPSIVNDSLHYENLPENKLKRHYITNEDADYLRGALEEKNLLAFIANDSILPRRSGIDARPMKEEEAIPFRSPDAMTVEFKLPNKGLIQGMGIQKGINLIVGGGFHGKSTLLNAIEHGIYNHIPEDGREYVVTNPMAVKIRSEDRRSIRKVDISPFINNLPLGKSTKEFSTEDASGSTSQAANIIEAIEAGAQALLIDEDTSATNFMIRDNRMQKLIKKEQEPITPFIDKVKLLKNNYDISTILVMGGSGDYFEVADSVIGMNNYIPEDLTKKVAKIIKTYEGKRNAEGGESFGKMKKRIPKKESIDPSKGKKRKRIKTGGIKTIQFGREVIDISAVEQIADSSQVNAIGEALVYAKKYMENRKTLKEIIDRVEQDMMNKGLNIIGHPINGNYAFFRKTELAAALNRLRSLEIIE